MSETPGVYIRCRYSFLSEIGFICANGCALKDRKPCLYTDCMPRCPSYEELRAFTNQIGTWDAAEETNCGYKNDSKTEPEYP